MRQRNILLLILACLPSFLIAPSATAQNQTPAAVKDSTAMTIALQAMVAMGNGSQPTAIYQDAVATGTVVIHGTDGKDASYKILLKSKGLRLFRRDIEKPDGKTSYILNNLVACLSTPKGHRYGAFQNAVNQRVDYIPALSLLAEYAAADKQLQYAGTESINGSPASVIAISFQPPGIPQSAADLLRATQHTYWIDQTTGQVVKVRYNQFADNAINAAFVAEMYFSDYRNVNGLMVPFKRVRYLDGVLDDELTLTSVAINGGLPDSDFDQPCEVANAQ